jgi:hypothetical protein
MTASIVGSFFIVCLFAEPFCSYDASVRWLKVRGQVIEVLDEAQRRHDCSSFEIRARQRDCRKLYDVAQGVEKYITNGEGKEINLYYPPCFIVSLGEFEPTGGVPLVDQVLSLDKIPPAQSSFSKPSSNK